jgi:DNA-binding response OmpR family regulator
MASILMLGLENDLADQMSRVLRQDGHVVQTADSIGVAMRARGVDILFAGGDEIDYRDTVMRLTTSRPDVPLVIVNRHPENSRWLDALELGAADYCGAPFEPVQMRWLLDSVLRRPTAAAA